MNQGIAFSRTLRALDADDFRASKLGLLMAAVLFAAWAWWMFAARVPRYESTTNVRIESGRAIAYFSADAMGRISIGQPAVVHVEGSALSSRVQSISSDHIDLALPANSQSPTALSADIEIARVSPAAVALQTLTRGKR
ncbi:MAG: hypothetical protein ACLPWF_06450 [Bryobacteraceae bacterium]